MKKHQTSFFCICIFIFILPSLALHSTFSVLEALNPNPNNFRLVSHQYSNYRGDSINGWNTWKNRDLQLINLAETIDKIPNCLHHLVNYNGIDLDPTTTPLVLSRYDVVHVKYQVLSHPSKIPKYTEWTRTFPFEKYHR